MSTRCCMELFNHCIVHLKLISHCVNYTGIKTKNLKKREEERKKKEEETKEEEKKKKGKGGYRKKKKRQRSRI